MTPAVSPASGTPLQTVTTTRVRALAERLEEGARALEAVASEIRRRVAPVLGIAAEAGRTRSSTCRDVLLDYSRYLE